jgi:hypothetical protein
VSLPAFLRFAPVEVRARHDGWSPDLQRRFVLHLARGSSPSEAARSVGRSRQSAYNLRRHREGAGFAIAWDAALAFARKARIAGQFPVMSNGFETVLVPRFYRGRLVGYAQREDHWGALRTMAKLDRLAESIEGEVPEIDFETLVQAAVAREDQAPGS